MGYAHSALSVGGREKAACLTKNYGMMDILLSESLGPPVMAIMKALLKILKGTGLRSRNDLNSNE
jgi:hypothetical protein